MALGHGGKEGRGLIGHATPAVGGETVARCIQPMEQCDAWIGWLMTDGTSLESRDACEWLFFSFLFWLVLLNLFMHSLAHMWPGLRSVWESLGERETSLVLLQGGDGDSGWKIP